MASDAVQQIKERLSIVDVVAPYVELHQAGKNMKGKSPFTPEKTPSFFVSPDRGMYYCFSSSKGGDMFTFVQEMEGVDFKGSLKILAEKAGVELVPEDPKKRGERDTGYSLLDTATTFYAKKLSDFEPALKYLKDRGIKAETIARWRIGYAPGPPHGGWRDLRTHLKSKNFTDEQMLRAGVIKTAGEGKEPYDVFRDRIMFPIFDSNGKVIAYSGRILAKDTEAPKYVNSPETEFFNKSEALYGYDRAKQGIRKFDFSLIVEGQFDVVLAHQAGYNNTVAVSGTALTEYHTALLQRLTNRVVLALDADRAGIAAVKRAADLMLKRGIDLKVANLPEGKDPADLIANNPADFKLVIKQATHVIEFLLAILKTQAKDDRTYKLRVREEVLPYIAKMENKIDADHFISVVASAIASDKEAVRLEVVRLLEDLQTPKSVKAIVNEKNSVGNIKDPYSRRLELLAYLIVVADLLDDTKKEIIHNNLELITKKTLTNLVESIDPQKKSKLIFTLENELNHLPEKQLTEELSTKLREFSLLSIRVDLTEQKDALFEAERVDDQSQVDKLLGTISALQKELAKASLINNFFSEELDNQIENN
jgi:DNA primase